VTLRLAGLRPARPGRAGAEDGTVTAEAALVLPALVLALVAALGVAVAGAARVACVDAAGSAARSLARGDAPDRARALALAAAPGAAVDLGGAGDRVVVVVSRQVGLPGLLRGLRVTVSGRAAAVREPGAAA
jgi:Flp pilus assembly protein TadG